jgi:hypothetical protein
VDATLSGRDNAGSDKADIGVALGSAKEVDFETLVNYARRISRYTVPPTLRSGLALPNGKEKSQPDAIMSNGETPAGERLAAGTSNTNTPRATSIPPRGASEAPPASANLPDQQAQTSPVAPLTSREQAHKIPEMTGVGWTLLRAHEKNELDKISSFEFVPWPLNEEVMSGALAKIQAMKEQGMDPANMPKAAGETDQDAQQGPDDTQMTMEEDERRRQEEAIRKASHEQASRRSQASNAEGQQQQRAFPGLNLYDPDADED